jgi:hypothetical protein
MLHGPAEGDSCQFVTIFDVYTTSSLSTDRYLPSVAGGCAGNVEDLE